jgi:hypothetical protein
VAFGADCGLAAAFSEPLEVAELAPEPASGVAASLLLAGAEGVVTPELSFAEVPLLGPAASFGAIVALELPVVEPLVPESWANAGAKAANDNAKPAPSK